MVTPTPPPPYDEAQRTIEQRIDEVAQTTQPQEVNDAARFNFDDISQSFRQLTHVVGSFNAVMRTRLQDSRAFRELFSDDSRVSPGVTAAVPRSGASCSSAGFPVCTEISEVAGFS
ncbi:hypothetical protein TKK_0014844 [Trichogramma kaykai]